MSRRSTPSETRRNNDKRMTLRMFATLYPEQVNKTTAYDIIAKRLRLSKRTVWTYLKEGNAI